MFPEHPIHFLISVYSFITPCPPHPPILELRLLCWQRIWLILTHCIGFHHLLINEANSTRRRSSGSILCANSKCDIRSLADCLIARLIIHSNSTTGLISGALLFWHANSDTHHNSASLQKIVDRYLYASTWWNVVPAPCLHLGNFPKHPFNKSQGFKYLQTQETETSYHFLFSVIAFYSKELNQLYLPYSRVSDKNCCISGAMIFFLIIDISSHKY